MAGMQNALLYPKYRMTSYIQPIRNVLLAVARPRTKGSPRMPHVNNDTPPDKDVKLQEGLVIKVKPIDIEVLRMNFQVTIKGVRVLYVEEICRERGLSVGQFIRDCIDKELIRSGKDMIHL